MLKQFAVHNVCSCSIMRSEKPQTDWQLSACGKRCQKEVQYSQRQPTSWIGRIRFQCRGQTGVWLRMPAWSRAVNQRIERRLWVFGEFEKSESESVTESGTYYDVTQQQERTDFLKHPSLPCQFVSVLFLVAVQAECCGHRAGLFVYIWSLEAQLLAWLQHIWICHHCVHRVHFVVGLPV